MCGRFYLDESVIQAVRQYLGELGGEREDMKTKDVYPSQKALVLTSRNTEISAELMAWGFPRYEGKGLVINARAETALKRPMFQESVKHRRCVIPAKHFYEWDKDKNKVTFSDKEEETLYMAGMFDCFQGEDRFLVITTQANDSMRPVHDRMPLLLEKSQIKEWLCSDKRTEEYLGKRPKELKREQEYHQESLFPDM